MSKGNEDNDGLKKKKEDDDDDDTIVHVRFDRDKESNRLETNTVFDDEDNMLLFVFSFKKCKEIIKTQTKFLLSFFQEQKKRVCQIG